MSPYGCDPDLERVSNEHDLGDGGGGHDGVVGRQVNGRGRLQLDLHDLHTPTHTFTQYSKHTHTHTSGNILLLKMLFLHTVY